MNLSLLFLNLQKMGKNSVDHLICSCLESFIDFLEEMLNIFCGEKGNALILNIWEQFT